MPNIGGKIVNRSVDNGALDDFEVVGGYKVVQTHDALDALKETETTTGKHILTDGCAVYVSNEQTTYRWNATDQDFVAEPMTLIGDPDEPRMVPSPKFAERAESDVFGNPIHLTYATYVDLEECHAASATTATKLKASKVQNILRNGLYIITLNWAKGVNQSSVLASVEDIRTKTTIVPVVNPLEGIFYGHIEITYDNPGYAVVNRAGTGVTIEVDSVRCLTEY